MLERKRNRRCLLRRAAPLLILATEEVVQLSAGPACRSTIFCTAAAATTTRSAFIGLGPPRLRLSKNLCDASCSCHSLGQRIIRPKRWPRSFLSSEGQQEDNDSSIEETAPPSLAAAAALVANQTDAANSSLLIPNQPQETAPPIDVASTSSQSSTVFSNEYDDSDMQSDPRYATSAWFDILRQTPGSSVLRSTKGPVLAVLVWSLAWSFLLHRCRALQRLALPALPHAVCISAVSLLLVFRTNSAYQKFNEGRLVWERVLSASRNLTRLIRLYPEFDFSRRQRMHQLLAAFPYLLHQHVMTVQDKATAMLLDKGNSKSMPWCLLPDAATVERCAAAENRPLWICDRLGQEINAVPYNDNYTNRERSKFLGMVGQLSESIGECERIHRTSVPLHYARHCLRVLTLWLLTLPLAMRAFEWWTAALSQVIMAWLLMGIYQIGYKIEDPFQGSLRLSTLCDGIYRNVRMERRASAFDVQLDRDPNWKNLPL